MRGLNIIANLYENSREGEISGEYRKDEKAEPSASHLLSCSVGFKTLISSLSRVLAGVEDRWSGDRRRAGVLGFQIGDSFGFMSVELVRLFAGEEDSSVKKLKIRSSSSSLLRPSCFVLIGRRPILCLFFFMQRRLAGTKNVSMSLPFSRPGFGVKYFGFLHIDPTIFLFLFPGATLS